MSCIALVNVIRHLMLQQSAQEKIVNSILGKLQPLLSLLDLHDNLVSRCRRARSTNEVRFADELYRHLRMAYYEGLFCQTACGEPLRVHEFEQISSIVQLGLSMDSRRLEGFSFELSYLKWLWSVRLYMRALFEQATELHRRFVAAMGACRSVSIAIAQMRPLSSVFERAVERSLQLSLSGAVITSAVIDDALITHLSTCAFRVRAHDPIGVFFFRCGNFIYHSSHWSRFLLKISGVKCVAYRRFIYILFMIGR